MRMWAKIAAVAGCCALVFLVFLAPHGQVSGRGQIMCAPLIGQAPAREYVNSLDTRPDRRELNEGVARQPEDMEESTVVCEQRRTARLAWAVLIAVPTSALLGVWVSTVARSDD